MSASKVSLDLAAHRRQGIEPVAISNSLPSFSVRLTSAMGSSIVSAVATTPFDVIKTRLQVFDRATSCAFNSSVRFQHVVCCQPTSNGSLFLGANPRPSAEERGVDIAVEGDRVRHADVSAVCGDLPHLLRAAQAPPASEDGEGEVPCSHPRWKPLPDACGRHDKPAGVGEDADYGTTRDEQGERWRNAVDEPGPASRRGPVTVEGGDPDSLP
eukprot:758232-Hanusia_phi.AAC.6